MSKIALNYLTKNPLLHMGMLMPIKRGTSNIIYAGNDGVLLKETVSGAFMLSAGTFETGIRLIKLIDNGQLFALHQDFMVDIFKETYQTANILKNVQAVYFLGKRLPVPDGIVIKPLDKCYIDIIAEHYHVNIGREYIENRIKTGALFGGFVDGTLCGFIGTHEEGGIGLLEVFKPYQNMGFGKALLSYMVNIFLDEGLTPFDQIGVDNAESIGLHKKLGFEISSDRVYWLF